MPQRLSAAAAEFSPLAYSQLPPWIPHPSSRTSSQAHTPAGGKQQAQPPESEREQPAGSHQPRPPGLGGEGDSLRDVQQDPTTHYAPSDGGSQPQQLMWNPEDAQQVEDWQQQVEEAVALHAILEDAFLLLGGLPGSALDVGAPDAAELAAGGPLDGSTLECQIAVYVDVPPEGICLQPADASALSEDVAHSADVVPHASAEEGSKEAPPATSAGRGGPVVHHLPPICVNLRFPRDYPSASPPQAQLSALWLTPADAALLHKRLAALWDEQGCGLPMCYGWVEWLNCSALPTLGYAAALPMIPLAAHQARLLQYRHVPETSFIEEVSTGAGLWRPAPRNGVPSGASQGQGQQRRQRPETQSSLQHSRVICSEVGELQPDMGIDVDDASECHAQKLLLARAVEEVTVQLLIFDATRDFQLFQKDTWQCGVCFEEALGRDCVRVQGCGHAFCAVCVGTHCRLHVREGSVGRLTCLAFKCSTELSQQVLARVLSAAELERCGALVLARGLDRMPDLVYCPRCEDATIEDSQHCAQCSKCLFAFCSLCNESWHPGGGCVSLETQLAIIRQRMLGRRDDVEALRRQEGEMLSLARIKRTAKQCPSCNMAIDKSEGCNKMTCTYCGASFCFRCLQVIAGYDHFQGSACILFDDAEVQRWNLQFENERRMLGQVPEGALGPDGEPIRWNHRRCPCPQCGTANYKEGNNNNHMNCWACATPFCFLCRAQLRREGGRHFGRSPKCKQHTIE